MNLLTLLPRIRLVVRVLKAQSRDLKKLDRRVCLPASLSLHSLWLLEQTDKAEVFEEANVQGKVSLT